MSIVGIFTDIGIQKAQEAQSNQGFKIFPTGFGVSSQKTLPMVGTITDPNGGLWFQGLISSRVVVNSRTIKFVCTVPPGVIPDGQTQVVREIYLFGIDSGAQQFMFALGQTSVDVIYDPSGSVTLDLEVSLTNVSIVDKVIFAYTQATELAEHNTDPNAHPELVAAVNRAGIFQPAGGVAFRYAGQDFDDQGEFQGTKATGTYGGVTYSAVANGPEWNGSVLTFNGTATVNAVVAAWNAANPAKVITFTPSLSGTNVPAAGSVTLLGGTLVVANNDFVYLDTDRVYKRALDDGTIRSKVAGVADIPNRIVRGGAGGFLGGAMAPFTTGQAAGTDLFLSTVTPGSYQTTPSATKVATVMDSQTIKLAGFGGGGSSGIGGGYDAVVSDSPGFHFYPTTQEAIDNVGTGSRIRLAKYEQVVTTIDTQGKQLTIDCSGPTTGWTRYLGSQEQQKITFASVPTAGTWRIEWNSQVTADLAFNANAAAIQSAFNALSGHNGVVVTGNYSTGFFITFSDLAAYPLVTFNATGIDKIQRLSFSAVPDDGTFQVTFKGAFSIHIPWDDSLSEVQADFSGISTVNNVVASGGIGSNIDLHLSGVDGLQPQPDFIVVDNSLKRLGVAVNINSTVLQAGAYASNNLTASGNPVAITVQQTSMGNPIGPDTLMDITADGTRILGNGRVNNFVTGFDLNGFDQVILELNFDAVTQPFETAGSVPDRNFHGRGSFGLEVEPVLTVGGGGSPGDYPDLPTAYAAAPVGSVVKVLKDQTISAAQVWNKAITLEFAENARLLITAAIVGPVFTLSGRIKTRRLRVAVSTASATYSTMFLFQGVAGHHTDMELELTGGAGLTVTNGFVMDTTARGVFVDALLAINSANCPNPLVNNSTVLGHNVVIRDIQNGTFHDLVNRTPPVQETPTGVVDSVNTTFFLSQAPATPTSITVTVDGDIIKSTLWAYNPGNLSIVFVAGAIPQLGQSVYVLYQPSNLFATPPSGVATPLQVTAQGETVLVETQVNTLDLGDGIGYSVLGPGRVQITGPTGPMTLMIREKTANRKRVIVTPAEQVLPSGEVLIEQLNQSVLSFDGAEVDFTTGTIYEADGVTVVGTFTAPLPALNLYRWFAFTIVPGGVDGQGRVLGELLVVPGPTDGATADLAPRPQFGFGSPRGQVLLHGNGVDYDSLTAVDSIYRLGPGAGGANIAAYREVPSGVVDGANVTFVLAKAPLSKDATFLFLDSGLVPQSNFTLLGATITFLSAPEIGQDLEVIYFPDPLGIGPPVGTIDLTAITVDPQPSAPAGHALGTAAKPWSGLYIKDTANGVTYRMEVTNGVLDFIPQP